MTPKAQAKKKVRDYQHENIWAGEMARWVKAAVAKPDDPSVSPGIHTVEGEM